MVKPACIGCPFGGEKKASKPLLMVFEVDEIEDVLAMLLLVNEFCEKLGENASLGSPLTACAVSAEID